MERGTLRRIFGKVAAVIAVVATLAFYTFGFQIGQGYYQDWQQSRPETTIEMVDKAPSPTENLPWAEAGVALLGAYGIGAAAIAAGKKKDRSGYGGGYSSGYSNSSGGGNFFFFGGSGSGGGGGGDGKGAAAALVIVGAAALAAGATVVSYHAVKRNFFTGEGPVGEKPAWERDLWKYESPPPAPAPAPDPIIVKSKPVPFKKKAASAPGGFSL